MKDCGTGKEVPRGARDVSFGPAVALPPLVLTFTGGNPHLSLLPLLSLPVFSCGLTPTTCAANFALPVNTGLLEENKGYITNTTEGTFGNCSSSTGNDGTKDFFVTFDVVVGGVSSPMPKIYKQVRYTDCALNGTVLIDTMPVQTVIIGLNKGVLDYIAWDDGCFFCAENGADCVKNTVNTQGYGLYDDNSMRTCRSTTDVCYSPTPVPTPAQTGPTPSPTATASGSPTASPSPSFSAAATPSPFANFTIPTSSCDLKIFVTWTGTDKNGQYLRSAGQRFSRYRQFSTASLFQSALNLGTEGLNLVNTVVNYAQNIPNRIIPTGGEDARRRLQQEAEEGEKQKEEGKQQQPAEAVVQVAAAVSGLDSVPMSKVHASEEVQLQDLATAFKHHRKEMLPTPRL